MITYLQLCPIHEHNYVCIKEQPLFPIVDGWKTFKVTVKCTICKSIIETYVKKISNKGETIMLDKEIDKKEFINYCANHFVISNLAGSHCDITMNDCCIGVAHKSSTYKDSYPIGLGLYMSNPTPRLLFKYDISKIESYKDFEKHNDQVSNVACIGFSESQQGWLGWSHRACFFFKIGYVVKEGSACTESGWTEDYEKQHPERCFNLPVGFTCKSLDDCRKCAIAYAMALA